MDLLDLQRLFPRIAAPLTLMAGLAALICVIALYVQQKRLEDVELRSQAQIVAAALEASSQMYGSATELMEYVQRIGARTIGVEQLALVDQEENRVIASTVEEWISRPTAEIPVLAPVVERSSWDGLSVGLGEDKRAFAIPVIIENASIKGDYGVDYTAVIFISSETFLAHTSNLITSMLWMAIVLGGLVFAGFFTLLNRNVLRPIQRIHAEVRATQEGASFRREPFRPDEIGALAQVIRSSYDALAASHKELEVLSQALDSTSNEVYVIDARDLSVLRANPQAAVNLGYSQEELLGMTVPDVAYEILDPDIGAMLTEQLAATGEISYQYQHRRKDGSEYPFEFKATLVKSHDQDTLIVLGNDVTDRINQEVALRRSEERMQLALRGSHDGLFEYSIDSGALYISELVLTWLETEQEQVAL